jgi:hypothetical protein
LRLTPVPMGERRSSGMSAPHSTYLDEDHLLVDVTVTEVKDGCALGLVLEHLDEAGTLIAAENVSTYVTPRTHQLVTTAKACRLRIKWVMTGLKPSFTFGVITEGLSSLPESSGDADEDPNSAVSRGLDLTTYQGLRAYLGSMTQQVRELSDRQAPDPTSGSRQPEPV